MALCRVDLAAVTSKYIGETEKHLARLLSLAEHEDVVLLFDEADSMFGRRTEVRDANDRFANAQTNYLLQRIESFESVAILTSNSRSRLDAAFTRRLDAIIEFAMPGPDERRDLWLAHLGGEHDVSSRQINKLAASCELAGGHVRNVVFAAAVMARSERRRIAYPDVVEGLKAEYRKMSQPLSPEVMSD
jgi:SpoVK/Ycf46/Vps4 family AAA+-type ATPase